MAELWEKYYSEKELKTLQAIEMENLSVFIDVCNQLGVEYFVYGGTLLGVEKYQGLIPWDDDIDVALPRESYDRFLKEAPAILPDGYFIQSPYNCPASPYSYTKLRKKGTKYIEYANRNVKIDTGIYIDIYPVDRIPDDETLRKKQFRTVRRWVRFYYWRQIPLYDQKLSGLAGKAKRAMRFVVCNVSKVFSQSYCMKKIDHYMTKYNNTDASRYAALHSPNYNNIYLHLYPLQDAKFEDLMVKIPGDHTTHLKMRYGDYSGLPPEDQRCGHVPYILDLGELDKGV